MRRSGFLTEADEPRTRIRPIASLPRRYTNFGFFPGDSAYFNRCRGLCNPSHSIASVPLIRVDVCHCWELNRSSTSIDSPQFPAVLERRNGPTVAHLLFTWKVRYRFTLFQTVVSRSGWRACPVWNSGTPVFIQTIGTGAGARSHWQPFSYVAVRGRRDCFGGRGELGSQAVWWLLLDVLV
jgi:hypothetical protein